MNLYLVPTPPKSYVLEHRPYLGGEPPLIVNSQSQLGGSGPHIAFEGRKVDVICDLVLMLDSRLSVS